MPTSIQHGYEEGDICGRPWGKNAICWAVLETAPVENCTCFLGHAPCSACTTDRTYCPQCYWEAQYDDPQPKGNEMTSVNPTRMVFLVNDDVRGINVSYEPNDSTHGPSLTLFKTLDQTIRVGQLVVVPTSTRHGFTVCKVEEVDVEVDLDSGQKVDWIAAVFYEFTYNNNIENEKELISLVRRGEKQRRREQLKSDLFQAQERELAALALTSSPEPEPATESDAFEQNTGISPDTPVEPSF